MQYSNRITLFLQEDEPTRFITIKMQIVCLSVSENLGKSTEPLPKSSQTTPTDSHYLSFKFHLMGKTPQNANTKDIVLYIQSYNLILF